MPLLETLKTQPGSAAGVEEDQAAVPGERFLFLKNGRGIKSRDIEPWDFLVIAILGSWIFSITHDRGTSLGVDVLPADAADLVLVHCADERETHDLSQMDGLSRIAGEVIGKRSQSIEGRAAIPLPTLSDQTWALERHAGQIHGHYRNADRLCGGTVAGDRPPARNCAC